MKRIGLLAILGGVFFAASTGVYIYVKYDELFEFPRLRAYVNNQLKDPGSTIYRNEHLKKSGWLCGELNSKNSSGGYVGFKRYLAGSADDAYLEDHGYVGVVNEAREHQVLLEKLDMKTEIIRERQELAASIKLIDIKLPSLGVDVEKLVEKRLFEKKWKQICE